MALDLQVFADLLRRKRDSRGVRAAALDAGVSPATFSRVENGGTPDVETFGKLCVWLGADPGPLLGLPARRQGLLPTGRTRMLTATEIGQMILTAQRSRQALQRIGLPLTTNDPGMPK